MQAGVRKLHLRLYAGASEHAGARRVLDQVVQERGFANPGFATHQQRAALPSSNGFDEPVEDLALALPAL
jgi:hypothetical protein